MTPRKRKPTSKILDDSADTAEPTLKRLKASNNTPVKRRSTPRATKVNRSDPDWLVTNEKSPLANQDLYTELSDPKTYENFTREDWDDLRLSLPSSVPTSSDGYSIPMDFFKYDADFRRGIREFQEDLSTGRLDPAWQVAAAQAMEERARGEFDAYKENQFEEFWGQKQKLDWHAVAGESAKLKLDVMIQNGIFQVGDYFSYSRVFGKSKNKLMVEKECKIVKVGSESLTFAIPPRQLKYARNINIQQVTIHTKHEVEGIGAVSKGDGTGLANPDTATGENQALAETLTKGNCPCAVNGTAAEECGTDLKMPGHEPSDESVKAVVTSPNHREEGATLLEADWGADEARPDHKIEVNESLAEPENIDKGSGIATSEGSSTQNSVILHKTSVLSDLEAKILEIDGRPNLKEVRASINAWRAFRGKRDNQDLGTLFEMREEFYVWKHAKIPQAPRSGACDLPQ